MCKQNENIAIMKDKWYVDRWSELHKITNGVKETGLTFEFTDLQVGNIKKRVFERA